MPKKNDKEVKKMRKIIIAVGLVLVSAVAMSADIPERRILNAVYDSAKEVLRIDLYDTATSPTVGGSPVSSANPMPVSGITSQSDTNVYVTNFPTDYKQSNTDVLIVGSLPAGTNSIGDIGTVSTVSSLTTGTVDIGKVDEISNITSVDLVDLITRITALESATIKYMPPVTATDLDIRDLGAGDTVGARQHGDWTVNNPSDVKVYAFTFYDTTASGTVTFTGVLKNIGITSGGAVTDSATIFINGVQYDCLLGGEDSGEGLEGYLLNPVIRWELYGVDRIRIKMSGYQN